MAWGNKNEMDLIVTIVEKGCGEDVIDYAKVAGGGDYRTTAGDRMRYKMLHKFHDYNKRFNEGHMCVGCGRCTSRCPEFISITTTLQKMSAAVEEIKKELGK